MTVLWLHLTSLIIIITLYYVLLRQTNYSRLKLVSYTTYTRVIISMDMNLPQNKGIQLIFL